MSVDDVIHGARAVPLDAPGWRGLLVAYLDGQPKAWSVLGDYLEESGLPRVRPGRLEQRQRRVIALLPPLPAHALGCDYAEHVLGAELDGEALLAARAALAAKRGWLAGGCSEDGLLDARRTALECLLPEPPLRRLLVLATATSGSRDLVPQLAASAVRAAAWRAYELAGDEAAVGWGLAGLSLGADSPEVRARNRAAQCEQDWQLERLMALLLPPVVRLSEAR